MPGLETSGQEEEEGGCRLGRDHGCWEQLSPAASCSGPCWAVTDLPFLLFFSSMYSSYSISPFRLFAWSPGAPPGYTGFPATPHSEARSRHKQQTDTRANSTCWIRWEERSKTLWGVLTQGSGTPSQGLLHWDIVPEARTDIGCLVVIGSCKHFIRNLVLFGVLELFSSDDHKEKPLTSRKKIKFMLLRVPEEALNFGLGVQKPQKIHSKATQSYLNFISWSQSFSWFPVIVLVIFVT